MADSELTEAQQETVVKLYLAGYAEGKIYTQVEEDFKKRRAVQRLVEILNKDEAFVFRRGTAKITIQINSKLCLNFLSNGKKSYFFLFCCFFSEIMEDVRHLVMLYESRHDSAKCMRDISSKLNEELIDIQEKSARILSKPPSDKEAKLFSIIQKDVRQKRLHADYLQQEASKLENLGTDEELRKITEAVEKAEVYRKRELKKLQEKIEKLAEVPDEENRLSVMTPDQASKRASKLARSAIKSKRQLKF